MMKMLLLRMTPNQSSKYPHKRLIISLSSHLTQNTSPRSFGCLIILLFMKSPIMIKYDTLAKYWKPSHSSKCPRKSFTYIMIVTLTYNMTRLFQWGLTWGCNSGMSRIPVSVLSSFISMTGNIGVPFPLPAQVQRALTFSSFPPCLRPNTSGLYLVGAPHGG